MSLIELTDPTAYIVKLWVFGVPIGKGLDWMQCLYRPSKDAPLILVGRMRVHEDDLTFGSEDRKIPFEAKPRNNETPEEFEAMADKAAIGLAEKFGAQLLSTRVDGGTDKFMEAIRRPPLDRFFHAQTGEPGESAESLLQRTKRKRTR